MKSQSQISRQARSQGGERMPLGLSLKHPVIDRHYHPTNGDFGAGKGRLNLSAPPLAPSFRELSNEFLGAEMKRDYLAEAFCFLIIVGISAWPIISMMRALSLVK